MNQLIALQNINLRYKLHFFQEHFGFVTTTTPYSNAQQESSPHLSTAISYSVTEMYDADLYEVVTAHIDSDTHYYEDDHESTKFTI